MIEGFDHKKGIAENIFIEKSLKYKAHGSKSIKIFAKNNPSKSIYIYENSIKPEEDTENNVWIKQSEFQKYHQERSLSSNAIVDAFLKKELSHADFENAKKYVTTEQAVSMIESHINKNDIIERIISHHAPQNKLQENNFYIPDNYSKDQASEFLNDSKFQKLINENPELLSDFINSNLLSEDLTKAVILKQRSESIAELEKSINDQDIKLNNKRENWFQDFFQKIENHWILGNAIDFKFIHQIESKHILPTSNGQRNNETDFILQNLFGYCSVVEIKIPETPLMKKKEIKSDPPSNIHDEKRTHIYIPNDDLIVGVSQVIHYQNRGVERSDSEGTKKFASNASGLVVIGNSKELAQNEQLKRSFELYINSVKNVTIMTYDELLKRAKQAIGCYDSKP